MTMATQKGHIWMDGAWLPWENAKTHLLTYSLHYGMGVFEGVRAYEAKSGTAIFRLHAHTDRLFRSAHILKMAIPYTKDELNQVQLDIIKKNDLKHAYIRPICFYGAEGMGLRADKLKVHVGIAAWEWGAYLGKENLEKGINVRVSSFTRHHVNIAMCKAKATGNYMNSALALREAIETGCDEALLLDPEGYVAEGSGENFFMVRDGVLMTPQLTSCLEGITRATIMQLAQDRGLKVVERSITRDEVYIAEEAFFTGTAAEVTPIRQLDGRLIGEGTRGPITTMLQKDYFDLALGKSEKYPEWLTYIN